MALTSIGALWLPYWEFVHDVAGTNFPNFASIGDADDKCAFIFRVPKTGTLHSFEYRNGTFGTLVGTVRFSFQDVDSSGNPDGTADQYRTISPNLTANAWVTPGGALTDDGTDIGTKRSVTKGDVLAVVIDLTAYTSGSTNIAIANGEAAVHAGIPYCAVFETSWSKDARFVPCFALKYDDGTYAYIPYAAPFHTINTHTINTTTTPDEVALYFTLSVPMTVSGFKASMDLDGDCDVILYDSDGSTVLTSASLASARRGATSAVCFAESFPTDVDLEANTAYRLAFKPTSTTSLSIRSMDVESADHMAAMPCGASYSWSERTDAGAWSQTATRRLFASLLVTRVHDGTGGGAGGGGIRLAGPGGLAA